MSKVNLPFIPKTFDHHGATSHAHIKILPSFLHARAANRTHANRLKRCAAGFAARQRDAPALGGGGGGEAQGALRAACGAESAGGAELRHEGEHEVLALDARL